MRCTDLWLRFSGLNLSLSATFCRKSSQSSPLCTSTWKIEQHKSQEEVMLCGASSAWASHFCQAGAGHLLWAGCAVYSISSSVTSWALYSRIKVLHVEDQFAGQAASVKASLSGICTNEWMNAIPLISLFLFVLINPCISFSPCPCLNILL